ncbi:MAG: HAD family hydrolase, partial [Syntrophobacteria bacterium]
IEAVGFDLFNTLITVEDSTLKEGLARLTRSLRQSGIAVKHGPFVLAHREAALRCAQRIRQDGRETHNRFWISAALETLGFSIPPGDPRIAEAVESYFSVFLDNASLLPGTTEMLEILQGRYRLGLLSNFTHPPAARKIMAGLGLVSFFEVVVISGDLGYRKPHPVVFRELIEQLGVPGERIAFVGDDPEADISGAQQAGLQPIWSTYVRDHHISPVTGMLDRPGADPSPVLARISNWEDLLWVLGLTPGRT